MPLFLKLLLGYFCQIILSKDGLVREQGVTISFVQPTSKKLFMFSVFFKGIFM